MILRVRGLEPLREVQAQHRSSCASCIGATQRSSGENKKPGSKTIYPEPCHLPRY